MQTNIKQAVHLYNADKHKKAVHLYNADKH